MKRLSELREDLENLAKEIEATYGPDVDPEVRIATQPNYPLQLHISNVAFCNLEEERDSNGHIVYIYEGGQCANPYLPRFARDLWG